MPSTGTGAAENVALRGSLDVHAQLADLATLEDGWLDGEGLAPARALLEWLAEGFSRHYPDSLSPPYLYPTAEGGVQAEWSLARREISLRFHPNNRTADWHVLALDSGEEEARSLALGDGSAWEWVAARPAPSPARSMR